MRTALVVAATLAAGLLGSPAAPGDGVPPAGLEGSFWMAEGTLTVQFVVKGAGSFQAHGAWTGSACDLIPGMVSFNLWDVLFEEVPGMDALPSYHTMVPGAYQPNSVKFAASNQETVASVGTMIESFYGVLSTAGAATVDWPPAKSSPVAAGDLADLTIPPESIKASGKITRVRDGSSIKGTESIAFQGTLSGGRLDGKTLKGKITRKFTGIPHGM